LKNETHYAMIRNYIQKARYLNVQVYHQASCFLSLSFKQLKIVKLCRLVYIL